jgi:hypothetical protein
MRRFLLLLTLALAVFAVSEVAAQSTGGPFAITRSVIAPATSSSGGAFSINAIVGQPSIADSTAGAYQLHGGFAAGSASDSIFSNGFEP